MPGDIQSTSPWATRRKVRFTLEHEITKKSLTLNIILSVVVLLATVIFILTAMYRILYDGVSGTGTLSTKTLDIILGVTGAIGGLGVIWMGVYMARAVYHGNVLLNGVGMFVDKANPKRQPG